MIHMGHEIFQILASKRMLSKLSESIGQTNMVVFRQVPDHLAEDFQFIARLGQVYTQVWRWSQQNYLYVFFKGFFYHLFPGGPEIGRASCRERVCKYV